MEQSFYKNVFSRKSNYYTFQITSNEKEWRVWYEKAKPEEENCPSGYHESLDVFRKLLLIRSWSPDRTLSQARKYIVGEFKFILGILILISINIFVQYRLKMSERNTRIYFIDS